MSSTTPIRPFKLKRPCPRCPFRSDIDKYLRPERVAEIADSLYGGAEFPCHETTEHFEGPDGWEERVAVPTSAFCAGALITMEREGFSNQMVRIGERLGMFNVDDLIMDSPVYDSLEEWVASFRDDSITITHDDGTTEVMEMEHCGVVTEACEDPPGYSAGGGVALSTEPPTCHPIDDCCTFCGSTMCGACRAEEDTEDGDPQCRYCAEEEDDDGEPE